jgi:2-keto-4-pentenoate hydratase/2-oxohepta-3-ene-1,7-dioic acid hydratase in catechol pathway
VIRLVRFDANATGLLVRSGREALVVDVAASLDALAPEEASFLGGLVQPGTSWVPLIEQWARCSDPLERLEYAAGSDSHDGVQVKRVGDVSLLAPLPEPSVRVFAMGGNFSAHEAGAREHDIPLPDNTTAGGDTGAAPWGFFVIPQTIVGPNADIRPPTDTQKLDYEAEVGVVLTGEPVDADGRVPIFGYTAWNDFSMRDGAFKLRLVDHGPLTWSLQKNFQTGNACGPCLVVDNGQTVDHVRLACRVNGEERQDATTAGMTFGFGQIAAYLSQYLVLRPGDMILSGTPSGTAMEGGLDGPFLKDGDEVEVEVEGVGVLRNRVRFPPR